MHVGTVIQLNNEALPKSLPCLLVDRIFVCTGTATCQTKFPDMFVLWPPSETPACTGNVSGDDSGIGCRAGLFRLFTRNHDAVFVGIAVGT